VNAIMRRRSWSIVLLWFAAFLWQPMAFAWNDLGHMVVADIAYRRLKEKTRARIDTLLKENPHYEDWNKALSANNSTSRRNEIIFMLAATWPDAIRLDPSYEPDGAQAPQKTRRDIAHANTGCWDHLMHQSWHFYNAQLSQDGTPVSLTSVPAPNAKTQIELFRHGLATSANDTLKSFELVWLVHLVADIHQPLHCVTRVSKFMPYGDDGGNDVLLESKTRYQSKLHAYWDGCLGSGKADDAVIIAKGLSAQTKYNSTNTNVSSWIQESLLLAKSKVYVDPIRWGTGPFRITARYEKLAHEEAAARIEVAGQRLANILNAELK
jgi:hypothetical protein